MPAVVACLLMGLGAIVLFRGLATGGGAIGRWHLRPLILVLAAIGVFASLIEQAGLPLAAMSIVLISAIAGHEFRWRETIILGLGLAIATTLLFIHALGLGMSTFPRW
jgi:putative tricarboxylic transport membrane protein